MTGFELSDLTIDCNLPATPAANTQAGAIRVRGKHIYLRRIKVKNYGAQSGQIPIVTAAGESSENCVIDDCTADPPAAAHAGKASVFVFEGTTQPHRHHRLCAIRNCAVKGLNSFENPIPAIEDRLYAISPGCGLGTVIEGNQIVNCAAGVYYYGTSSSIPAQDIVIWNNVFRNVWRGVWFDNSSTVTDPAIGRVVCQDNLIEFATAVDSPSDPRGLWFTTTENSTAYAQLTLRKNLIRAVTAFNPANFTPRGIQVFRCSQLIVENNIVSDTTPDSGVLFLSCDNTNFFNNQTSAGKLLRGYNLATARFALELEDEVQDALLAF